MANQLAIAVLVEKIPSLSGFSHVYRDEADAAQSVFQKVNAIGNGETGFTVDQLKKAVESQQNQEVFRSGVGAVSIENCASADGRMIAVEELGRSVITASNIKLHGARIYLAAAWSGVTVKEYASYFDTIYISLYKTCGNAGAILCGDKKIS
jgi:threonine aldolase